MLKIQLEGIIEELEKHFEQVGDNRAPDYFGEYRYQSGGRGGAQSRWGSDRTVGRDEGAYANVRCSGGGNGRSRRVRAASQNRSKGMVVGSCMHLTHGCK